MILGPLQPGGILHMTAFNFSWRMKWDVTRWRSGRGHQDWRLELLQDHQMLAPKKNPALVEAFSKSISFSLKYKVSNFLSFWSFQILDSKVSLINRQFYCGCGSGVTDEKHRNLHLLQKEKKTEYIWAAEFSFFHFSTPLKFIWWLCGEAEPEQTNILHYKLKSSNWLQQLQQ